MTETSQLQACPPSSSFSHHHNGWAVRSGQARPHGHSGPAEARTGPDTTGHRFQELLGGEQARRGTVGGSGHHGSGDGRWRVWFRHSAGVDDVTSNTYTLAEALAVVARWSPSIVPKVSLVPAGVAQALSPPCDHIGQRRHDLCSGTACSCTCHGLRESMS